MPAAFISFLDKAAEFIPRLLFAFQQNGRCACEFGGYPVKEKTSGLRGNFFETIVYFIKKTVANLCNSAYCIIGLYCSGYV